MFLAMHLYVHVRESGRSVKIKNGELRNESNERKV